MGLLFPDINQSYSSGGSVNSAYGYSNSQGSSASGTMADAARNYSTNAASAAYANNLASMREVMAFNAEEAQKQRDWEERMANTIYTRSVANMREAGINPILAANMGLSAAQVGSGATASMSGYATSPMAQNFMDSWSYGQNSGQSENWSQGSSWNNSEGGFATGLQALGGVFNAMANTIQSGSMLGEIMSGAKDIIELLTTGRSPYADNFRDLLTDIWGNTRRDLYQGVQGAISQGRAALDQLLGRNNASNGTNSRRINGQRTPR